MKPQTFTWKKLTADELTRVYLDEMRRDFPPSELKPLSMILNSEAVGMAHTWGVFEGETLVSYLLMVRPMGCEVSQLDYFSVLPAYRSTGIGAKLLDFARKKLPEHAHPVLSVLNTNTRAIALYTRMGWQLDGSTSLEFDPKQYPTVTRKCALVQMRYAGPVQE